MRRPENAQFHDLHTSEGYLQGSLAIAERSRYMQGLNFSHPFADRLLMSRCSTGGLLVPMEVKAIHLSRVDMRFKEKGFSCRAEYTAAKCSSPQLNRSLVRGVRCKSKYGQHAPVLTAKIGDHVGIKLDTLPG